MWRPAGRESFAPPGVRAKAAANLEALEVLEQLEVEERPPTAVEQARLARWAAWGALPKVFDDEADDWVELRAAVRSRFTDEEWSAARRTTLNAHYTDPTVVSAVWLMLGELGFTGGRVLEPGCGVGNFIGLTPERVEVDWTGVELDPVTARISRLLYPQARIVASGFEQVSLPPASFDAVVGNVPFGAVALHDPTYNRAGESIHNHFIIKSLNLLRPGGTLAVLTSRYTLDATNPQARAAMGELADLVTAVRLPSSTHREVAGTEVVTDLLVLRRRDPDRPSASAGSWLRTDTLDTVDGPVTVNEWFIDHPELMLGQPRLGGAYRADDLQIAGRLQPEELDQVVVTEATAAVARGHGHHPTSNPQPSTAAVAAGGTVGERHKAGSIVELADGAGFATATAVGSEPLDVPASSRAELSALCGIRDVLLELLDEQSRTTSDDRVTGLQQQLSDRYDQYVQRWGPLNRFRWGRTGRTDPDTGQEVMRRLRPKMGGFRDDPDAPSVLALEEFDPATQQAAKSAVFSRRILVPREPRRGTDDPSEAVLICLDQRGRVDLEHVADLLGIDENAARARLGELVFDDPEHPGRLETAAAYLSGDVRTKRDTAAAAAQQDPRFEVNVAALDAVMPVDLTAEEIDVWPGQSWIAPEVVSQFVAEVFDVDAPTVGHDLRTAAWEIDVPRHRRGSVTMTSEWGTERRDAVSLLQAACNNSPVMVYDEDDDGRRVLNREATVDAREKQQQIIERFSSWVWEDPTRASELAAIYNRRFNAHVERNYTGDHLSLPGLSSSFTPRSHQMAAVARILEEPTTLLAHEVGAGKTATMVIAAMELRRLRLVNKPMVVVPNHMLEQFCTEWRSLYPTAKVLFPTDSEQGPAGRKKFVARAAVGEWDAVVVTQSVFERIPLSPETEAGFIREQADELRESSAAMRRTLGRTSRTVKEIERRVLQLEERSKDLLHRVGKDDGATFEQLGVDYLFIDEAHVAKNLAISTRMPGLGKQGSGFATQLDIRLRWLREQYGPKVLTLATATPIANSLSEMWVMQHYATPELLESTGTGRFDAWASNFAAQVTRLELAPEGTHYRIVTRLSKFRNVPELVRMFSQFADVRSTADLDLPTPELMGGRAEVVVVEGSSELSEFVSQLGDRAEQVRNRSVDPTDDNMLKISSDGRAAALDMRLVGESAPIGATKIATAADRITQIWADHHDRTYLDPAGAEHPRPGGLQLVFAELGTPGGERWGLYDELRRLLVERGIPREQVRFMHEANNPRAKEQLFAACRDGSVSVLIGTTDKMGVGTNVQARCVALHHLDCPWRPADVQQREGRILRQGNQNPTVQILRYVTEGSFDVYMWQTVETKSGFIHQVLSGRAGARQLDDVAGEQELSFAEVKALATGDERIMRRASLEADVARLRRQRSAHYQDQSRLQRTISRNLDRLGILERKADELDTLNGQRLATRGDQFTMTIDNRTHTGRVPAGEHVLSVLDQTLAHGERGEGTDRTVVTLGGVRWQMRCAATSPDVVELSIGRTGLKLEVTRRDLSQADPARLVQRLERLVEKLPDTLTDTRRTLEEVASDTRAAQARLGGTFDHQDELDRVEAELETLTAELGEHATEPPSPSEQPSPGPTP